MGANGLDAAAVLQIFEAKGRRDAATRGGVGSVFLFFLLLRFFVLQNNECVFVCCLCLFVFFSGGVCVASWCLGLDKPRG